MAGMEHSRFWRMAGAALLLSGLVAPFALAASQPLTIEELKAKIANATIVDRPPLCLQISERQLGAAGRFYSAGDSEQAKIALADVVAFSELARDYSIQSHKHEKKSEIAIRGMVRKLDSLKHTVSHEDQEQVQSTVDRLQRIRDDLLSAMFPKGLKK
jgi:molecular chaperone GrpE (heat shock protein)